MERFAALDDQGLGHGNAGGTWWQWEQECGDPHDMSGVYPPTEADVQARLGDCGRSGGGLHCTDRPYPRAVPGRLESTLASCVGSLDVSGSTDTSSVADLWFPGDHGAEPTVTGTGIESVIADAVDGGWNLSVRVNGRYRIVVRST